jgi:hypothetical protein
MSVSFWFLSPSVHVGSAPLVELALELALPDDDAELALEEAELALEEAEPLEVVEEAVPDEVVLDQVVPDEVVPDEALVEAPLVELDALLAAPSKSSEALDPLHAQTLVSVAAASRKRKPSWARLSIGSMIALSGGFRNNLWRGLRYTPFDEAYHSWGRRDAGFGACLQLLVRNVTLCSHADLREQQGQANGSDEFIGSLELVGLAALEQLVGECRRRHDAGLRAHCGGLRKGQGGELRQ